MKKLYLYLLLINIFSYGQIINIPDPVFKALLLGAGTTNTIAGQLIIDVNNNNEIEQSEALLVSGLVLPPGNIVSLTGIEYFTNLYYLTCYSNLINSADLSASPLLVGLHISNNQLTSLNLTGLTNLEYIFCGGNPLTEVDFSTLTSLQTAYCGQDLHSVLDFSNNPNFKYLTAFDCPNLTTIKINNNFSQIFPQTNFSHCWDNNPNLVNICVDANEVAATQAFLALCNITQPINISTDCILSTENFVASSFSIAPNPTKGNISFDNSKASFQAVNVYNYLGQEILSKRVEFNLHEQLDFSSLEKGIYIVKFSNEKESKIIKVIKN
jgi:hypothetical protein